MLGISAIDFLLSIILEKNPAIANTLRPVIAIFFLKQVRQNKWQFHAVFDNLAILVTIFVFIMFYSVGGFIFFSFTG